MIGSRDEVVNAGYGQVALHNAASNRFIKMSSEPCSSWKLMLLIAPVSVTYAVALVESSQTIPNPGHVLDNLRCAGRQECSDRVRPSPQEVVPQLTHTDAI